MVHYTRKVITVTTTTLFSEMTLLSENAIVSFNMTFVWERFSQLEGLSAPYAHHTRDAYSYLFILTNLLGGSGVDPDVDVP